MNNEETNEIIKSLYKVEQILISARSKLILEEPDMANRLRKSTNTITNILTDLEIEMIRYERAKPTETTPTPSDITTPPKSK